MADRKGRSVTFKTAHHVSLGVFKTAIDGEISGGIVVFQDLGNEEYLIELEDKEDAENLIERGFDVEESHVSCHPPQGKYVNVSIMGLRSYIDDEDLIAVLSDYGEIKSDVIRLKYKANHELAGLQNGNRLVKMVIEKPSIPYSVKISGEWCRIIHNNQQPLCSECSELGHVRRECPYVTCRVCHDLGHMSYSCKQREKRDKEQEQQHQTDGMHANEPTPEGEEKKDNENPAKDGNDQLENMDFEDKAQGVKRQHTTDSDSDGKVPTRRARVNPTPNLIGRRRGENLKAAGGAPKPT